LYGSKITWVKPLEQARFIYDMQQGAVGDAVILYVPVGPRTIGEDRGAYPSAMLEE
jgi:hypothetical protein